LYVPGQAPGGNIPSRCEQTGKLGYCYHATPIDFNMTGIRSFVAATSGTIYEKIDNGAQVNCVDGKVPTGSGDPIS
jgi:hypothetical protein